MFNSYLLDKEEQLKERVKNRLKLKKNSLLCASHLGFDWFRYFFNPILATNFEKDIIDWLKEDEEISTVKLNDLKEDERELVLDLAINNTPITVGVISNEK